MKVSVECQTEKVYCIQYFIKLQPKQMSNGIIFFNKYGQQLRKKGCSLAYI